MNDGLKFFDIVKFGLTELIYTPGFLILGLLLVILSVILDRTFHVLKQNKVSLLDILLYLHFPIYPIATIFGLFGYYPNLYNRSIILIGIINVSVLIVLYTFLALKTFANKDTVYFFSNKLLINRFFRYLVLIVLITVFIFSYIHFKVVFLFFSLVFYLVSLVTTLEILEVKKVKKWASFKWLHVIIYAVLTCISLVYISQSKINEKWEISLFNGLNLDFITILAIWMMLIISIYNLVVALFHKEYCQEMPSRLYHRLFSYKELMIKFFLYLHLCIMVIIVMIPIIYIIGAALTNKPGISTKIFPAFNEISFKNFKELFNDREYDYKTWYWHSLQIAIVNMFASVILTTMTAYIFSRYKFKGKKFGLIAILVLQMFPSFMSLIALYVLFQGFGLLGKPLALVLVYATGQIPYNTWLVKGYMSNIPKSLDESARIDGANGFQIFRKIIFPLSLPILTFVAVTQFMAPWMDYLLANFLLGREQKNWTLAIGLFNFINSREDQNYTKFAAGGLLVAVPIAVLYASLQKFLIEGITAGANKG